MLRKQTIDGHINRLRSVCDSLPEVEVRAGQHYTFVVRGKKFAYYLIDHHGDGRVSMQCKAPKGLNASLVESGDDRFFLPAYMAHHGWIGVYVDAGKVDWDELEGFFIDAYRLAAPKTLARQV